MNTYTIYFTEGRFSYTIEIHAENKLDAIETFKEMRPTAYIEEVELS